MFEPAEDFPQPHIPKVVFAVCRLYYNRSGVPGREWSVDNGPAHTEIQCGGVCLGNKVTGKTVLDSSADNVREPRAWIQFHNVVVSFLGNILTIEDAKPAGPDNVQQLISTF